MGLPKVISRLKKPTQGKLQLKNNINFKVQIIFQGRNALDRSPGALGPELSRFGYDFFGTRFRFWFLPKK